MAIFSLAGRGLKLDTAEDIKQYIKPLAESQDFHQVDLSGNTFGIPACEALAPLLSSQQNLETADLHDIFTSRTIDEIPQALTALLNALLKCPKLQTMDLSDNAFGLRMSPVLVAFLCAHIPLRHLILNNNGMGPYAGTEIADALSELAQKKAHEKAQGRDVPPLESVVCGRNRLESGSMKAWASAYRAHSAQLKSVKMTQNGVRPEGISHLLREGLSHCHSLETLDLQDNTFTHVGASALAEAAAGWTDLKELGLGDCLLTANGSIKIFDVLGKGQHSKLEVLRLQYNDITSRGVEALQRAAKDGLPKLRRVELNGNKFSEDDSSVEALAELLSARKEGKHPPDDEWGLDELDELEDDSEDEDEAEAAEEEDEEEDARERVLKEADEVEDQKVSQKKDPDVDDLADALKKTEI